MVAPEVVIMTTSGATNDNKVGIMTNVLICVQRQTEPSHTPKNLAVH